MTQEEVNKIRRCAEAKIASGEFATLMQTVVEVRAISEIQAIAMTLLAGLNRALDQENFQLAFIGITAGFVLGRDLGNAEAMERMSTE